MGPKEAAATLAQARPYLKEFCIQQIDRHGRGGVKFFGVIIHPRNQSWKHVNQLNHFSIAGQNNLTRYVDLNADPPRGRSEYREYYYFSVEQIMNDVKTLEMVW